MSSWDECFPETLAPGKQALCDIGFADGLSSGDDGGEVSFILKDTPYGFQIQARGRPQLHVQVDWSGLEGRKGFFMFPPPSGVPSSPNPGLLQRAGSLYVHPGNQRNPSRSLKA